MADRPLAIGIVLHDFALGGTERIAARLAARWSDVGARVTIFCGSRSGTMSSHLGHDVEVVEARPAIRRSSRSRAALARAAADHFTRHPVDVCFIPGNFHWPVVGPLTRIARRHRPAVVVQISAALRKPQRGALRQRIFDLRMRWLLRGADAIVALSLVAERQARRLMRPGIVRTIPLPAIDGDTPEPIAVPPGPPLILGVGRLVPEKGFDTLIRAFARLSAGDARLAIVGAGADEPRLKSIARTEGVADRVEFPGYAVDPRPWFDRARLFVLSSRFEGYAAVLVEALAAGRMVVATACTPAAAELIDDPSVGEVVPIDDPAAMAAALDRVLAAPPTDPAALAARVERFRMAPVADTYLALFERLRRRR